MVIISSFKLIFNENGKYFAVKTEEFSNCPFCGGDLKYRDSVFRNLKDLASEVTRYLIRRLLCLECRSLHRELPDIIQPYKHYGSAVIQAIIDNGEEALSCAADNSTIVRWKTGFANAASDINQRLSSVYVRMTENTVPLAKTETILKRVRKSEGRWLAYVMKLLINGGHKIRTRFAFCLPQNTGKLNSAIKINAEGDGKIDNTNTDTS